MAKQDLGKKRRCASCGMKFYDFNKTKIECPSCQTVFNPDQLLKSRKGRMAKVAEAAEVEADTSENDEMLGDDEADETDTLGGDDSFVPIAGSDSDDDEGDATLLDDNVEDDFIDEIDDSQSSDEEDA